MACQRNKVINKLIFKENTPTNAGHKQTSTTVDHIYDNGIPIKYLNC